MPFEAFAAVLARHGLTGRTEEPFEHDGWSGARLARIRAGAGYVVKRDALGWDWIAQATADGPVLREAWLAAGGLDLPPPVWAPYLGVGADGPATAILMPDLTGTLLPWEAAADLATLDRVLAAMAALHAADWSAAVGGAAAVEGVVTASGVTVDRSPWCPLRERLLLLSPPAAERYRQAGNPVGERFLAGWDAFDRWADPAAVALIARLSADPAPLLAALDRLPATVIHGDLKLANVGPTVDGRVAMVDWQMIAWAPIAVELGWFLVANVASLPLAPEAVLARYRTARAATSGAGSARDAFPAASVDARSGGRATAGTSGAGSGGRVAAASDDAADDRTWAVQADLAWLVGLLLRGWRKGLDAHAGVLFPARISAADDLAWWCARALAAADRHL